MLFSGNVDNRRDGMPNSSRLSIIIKELRSHLAGSLRPQGGFVIASTNMPIHAYMARKRVLCIYIYHIYVKRTICVVPIVYMAASVVRSFKMSLYVHEYVHEIALSQKTHTHIYIYIVCLGHHYRPHTISPFFLDIIPISL